HRRDELRAGVQLQERAFKNEKINFIWNTEVEKVLFGEGEYSPVNGVQLKNRETGESHVMPTQGVFIFIGHNPNSPVFDDQIALNDNG
ncbi:MAG: NAD(P)/FAD-dependent oxidoreductase, partial [Aggregatilineales bacterium]